MKKFLEDLKKELNLRNISQEDINEIISDHEEMIESALAKGLSDSEIIKQLGNPSDLAQALAEFSEKGNTEENDPDVYTLWKEYELYEDNLSIQVKLLFEDIAFKESKTDKLSIYYKGSKNLDHYESVYEKGVFRLEAQKEYGFSFFRKFSHKIAFVIEVPKTIEIEDFKFKSVSSDVQIKNITAKKLAVSLTSGDVEIRSVEIGEAQWHTVSGDINAIDSKFNILRSSQISGDLAVQNVAIIEQLELNTVSGDIKILDASCDKCELHTVSGDTTAAEFYPKSIEFKSVSGDLSIKNLKETDIQIVTKKSISGNINISIAQN